MNNRTKPELQSGDELIIAYTWSVSGFWYGRYARPRLPAVHIGPCASEEQVTEQIPAHIPVKYWGRYSDQDRARLRSILKKVLRRHGVTV